ncbi:MFS transporter [Litorihabitans aurantiacus]|uniref:Major facilitator superfamily (MFS) profile domain-containing protein n=1 Tax=Litorihabitans aurantiacus TaxID=1930061 RepID=A0AA37XHN7_9MICO|nr:hypothetical protein GCM10025875_32910 [Litorihabitans aurantiacus]
MSVTTRRDERVAPAVPPTAGAPGANPTPAHRSGVLPVMLALMMAMFVSMLAATVVSTSLPVIIADLGGDQAAFTWVVTAILLATTVSTPVWGKLADLFDRKVLLQLALVIFVVATAVAGLSRSTEMLIAMRVVQGLGAGGLAALSQIVMADVVSPASADGTRACSGVRWPWGPSVARSSADSSPTPRAGGGTSTWRSRSPSPPS